MGLVPCIAVSTGYILLTMFLAEALRKIVEKVLPEGLAKTALYELIAGAELCGCCFELIISKMLISVFIFTNFSRNKIECSFALLSC